MDEVTNVKLNNSNFAHSKHPITLMQRTFPENIHSGEGFETEGFSQFQIGFAYFEKNLDRPYADIGIIAQYFP